MKKLNDVVGVDFLFVSSCDHNEGTNNHGLFQMFDFFRKNLDKKSVFVSMLSSLYSNQIDVFNISNLGGYMPLSHQINPTLINYGNSASWANMFKGGNKSVNNFENIAAKVLISAFPKHKYIVVADKVEIELSILKKVMDHFNSKLIIISAVNNTWTGLCSYPEEHKCEKYKFENGCDNECPALAKQSKYNSNFVTYNFTSTNDFVKNNINSVILNVGCSFSLNEANNSYLFKDVKKVLIPLKNIETSKEFNQIWNEKKEKRKFLKKSLFNNFGIDNVNFFMSWSAYNIDEKRKGIDYLIESLKILKDKVGEDFEKFCLIICAKRNEEYEKILSKIGIKLAYYGFADRDTYNTIISASDVYCSTTISDAGPRTTYESAALATPIISFDNCNALDFVNSNNGALVKTYDVECFANELHRLSFSDEDSKKYMSKNMYDTYCDLMNTDNLANKWKSFFEEVESETLH